ncbi:MAG: glycosyl hydrolase family 32, partial [Actinomycetia bacterium]|nr:glycosyl hydrolase family 32 [Actinomycetes bacterium]
MGDPEQRHWNTTVGHAVSTDLIGWSVLPDAIRPGAPGDWDDYTAWTGSVIEVEGRWAMLYTGTSRSEDGLIQRIGLAWSDDLVDWEKAPFNPILEHDASRYEALDRSIWPDQAWRDPWVFIDPTDGRFHVLLTARVQEGPAGERGVVAHAVSDDLRRWTVLDPVTDPGAFGHLEIPQLVEAN